MFKIQLKNNKTFDCSEQQTIFEAALQQDIHLDHSCLSARCRSCIAKVVKGKARNVQDDLVLTDKQREQGYTLTCNAKPQSDIQLDIEDLGDVKFYQKRILPSKINTIEKIAEHVIKLELRLPPNQKFKFNAGQYVNLIKNNIKRSYSLANYSNSKLEFFIKNYKGGKMSQYLFEEAKTNDLIRVEGPLGTFFLRESKKENLIFLGTGTGVAPIKSILDDLNNKPEIVAGKKLWFFSGSRHQKDIFWRPNYQNLNVNYVEVLSRETNTFDGYNGYVQDAVLHHKIDLTNAQAYACGSAEMIDSSKTLLTQKGLEAHHFYADAFVQTN